MNTKYYLAVDIGASSGRHMLSHLENGKIVLEEIYRFPNGMIEKNGHKVWDVDQLFQEILIGMKKCAMVGKIPYSMGIDTWAVDFVLLDENDERIGNAVAYRATVTIWGQSWVLAWIVPVWGISCRIRPMPAVCMPLCWKIRRILLLPT